MDAGDGRRVPRHAERKNREEEEKKRLTGGPGRGKERRQV
jgi:hypothetical protein